ncbi:Amuc_1098 family type IV pilus outer membrane protein [Rubritalea tangerina]|uniref:Amuc_1098 family type IV pilus outer membrane protein n=2 Tax=Rubritalea tangerina TaxID=430798 RepID=A0ABW4ZFR1_9BACT
MEKIPTHRSSRTAAMLMAAAAVMPLASHVAQAQSLVQQEIARRAAQVQEADAALLEGRKQYAEGKYEEAVAEYRKALNLLPTGPAVADRRHAYTGHLVDGSIALSTAYRRVGRYAEARQILSDVLAKDPLNKAAKQQLEYLDDPIRTNPVLTYEHTQDAEKVRKHLYRAEGYHNLGKYDEAEEEYKEILRVDRYNKAARRGMERLNNIKSDYYRAAYDQTRAELLMEVDKAWEIAVAPRVQWNDGPTGNENIEVTGALYIRRKLQNITLPVVDFSDVTVDQAIDILRQRARELDTLELDPQKKGVNFVVRTPTVVGAAADDDGASEFGGGAKPGSKTISSLQLRNVPLEVAVQQICDVTGLRYKVEDYAVVLLPATDFDDAELYTRTFNVPPDFITLISGSGGGGGAASDDPFADEPEGGSALGPTPPVKELLENSGVAFPDGATASFSRARSVLTVRNTANNLDIVEKLVNDIKDQKPKQIRMSTKFVEINQENTDELSFDWILTPTPLNGASSVFLGGGTNGNGSPRTGGDFRSPVNGFAIPGIPSDPTQGVTNIMTGANRSGDYAITRDSIDAFINNPNRGIQNNSVAPGILSFTGLFTDGQVQMIMRGLSQKKGADVMTAPSIVARSGEKATIEIIREFIYPTEYEPPELPNNVGTTALGNGANGGLTGGAVFPVTPATPTAFETRNTGVTLEVEPTLGEDGYTIDLRFAPEIVDFEGFINYGSPIQTTASDALGNPVIITITENRIEMPVFSTRRVNTGLTIYDGHTVAVGGLMREDVQNVEDKVPILGDLPLVGRLFQSKAENHIKSNLIIFVSVNIIDATGKSVRNPMGELESADAVGGAVGGGDLLPPL